VVRASFLTGLLRRLALPSGLLLIPLITALLPGHELRLRGQTLSPGTVNSRTSAKAAAAPTPYALQPQLRAKAIRYSREQYAIYFGGVGLSLAVFTLLWLGGFGNWLRRIAAKVSKRLFVQCLVFVPVFWAIVSAIQFPLDYYSGFTVEHRFGLSTQATPSWLTDWAKTLGISVVVMVFVVWAFYRIARRSPTRWWLFFWLALIPPALFVMFIEPYVIEPLYFKFTPLEKKRSFADRRYRANAETRRPHDSGVSDLRNECQRQDAYAQRLCFGLRRKRASGDLGHYATTIDARRDAFRPGP
jgi:hypothetical protein